MKDSLLSALSLNMNKHAKTGYRYIFYFHLNDKEGSKNVFRRFKCHTNVLNTFQMYFKCVTNID